MIRITARVFDDFPAPCALRHADHVLSISENTAKDLQRYARSDVGAGAADHCHPERLSSFDEFLPKGDMPPELRQTVFRNASCCSSPPSRAARTTALSLDIWRRMLAAGDDPPHLVCVEPGGMEIRALCREDWSETGYLAGRRVILLQEVSDGYLRLLYIQPLPGLLCPRPCTRGWGLAGRQSLAAGKVCVRAAIAPRSPKSLGSSGSYIDIDDPDQSYRVVRELISG